MHTKGQISTNLDRSSHSDEGEEAWPKQGVNNADDIDFSVQAKGGNRTN